MTMQTLTIGGKTKRSTTGQHPVEIDFDALPDQSKAFIVSYGLRQYLADAMAGAEGEADAKAKIEARRAKLVSGDLSRTKGEAADKPDSVETRALKNAKAKVRETAKARNVTLTKEQVTSAAKAWIDKNPKWLAEAKKQLDAEAKAAEAMNDDEAEAIFADLIGSNDEAPAEAESE